MIGSRLGNRYEVIRELGRGGMGVVYLGRDPLLERDVALKLIGASGMTPELRHRFLREARVIAKIDHPGIVSVYDIGEHEDALFFVMPYVPGTNLREVLDEGPLSLGQLVELGIQAAEALDHAHGLQVVHRDIKPENIMVVREGADGIRVRMADFGLAIAAAQERLTRTGAVIGTVAYLSPEQVAGRIVDWRVDVYGLGTVLYECVAGAVPFAGDVQSTLYRIAHEHPRALRSFVADTDDELDAAVMACLAKDPERRTQSARELASALLRYRGKIASTARAQSLLTTVHTEAPPPPAAFVGRDEEFADLQARLNACLDGESQLVLVKGEPGIGKTRMLEELERLARARRIRVYEGHFAEQNEAFPYQGFCDIIDTATRRPSPSATGPSVNLSDLEADLEALFPQLGSPAAPRVSQPPPAPPAKQDKAAIFELIARALVRIGNGEPLVLLLEDLHAANVSVEALQYVARRLAATPTLIVGTFTSTEVDRAHPLTRLIDGFAGSKRFAVVELGRLGFAEHRALVEALAVGARLDDALAVRLYETTEGNPYFTRELVRALLDSGSIARDKSGSLAATDGGMHGFDALPETVQKAVERRVERLSEELRQVLSTASVLGKTFDERDLEAMVDDGVDLDDAIDRLTRGGFLEEQRKSRGDRLAFTSGAVRDVLYASIPRRKRRALHRRVAEDLERRNAGRLARAYPQLVHHYAQADVAEKVLEFGFPLARRSLAAFSADDALEAAKAILSFVDDDDAVALVADARSLLASAHRMAGNLEAAHKEIEKALAACERAADDARTLAALVAAADIAWEALRVGDAERWVEKGLRLARATGDMAELARLLSLGVTLANLRGDVATARERLEEADRLRPAGHESSNTRDDAATGGCVRVAMAGSVRAREPATVTVEEELEVLGGVFETLLATGEHGNLSGCLCERWEALQGGASFSFTIRAGVRRPDGGCLTAADVKASLERSATLSHEQAPAAFAAIRGIEVTSERELVVHLTEPLPIYPALLTDRRTAISVDGAGTGPFRVRVFDGPRVILERNDAYDHGPRPKLDAIEFHTGLSSAEIAAGLRAGRFDLARDVLPKDMDELVRDRRAGLALVEAPKRNVYFAQFNGHTDLGRSDVARAALFGTVRPQDLVWRHLGRLGQPAEGLIPPGVLGHDAGRRRSVLAREAGIELLAHAGLPSPVRVRVSAHPVLLDRFAAITEALFDAWRSLGTEVDVVARDVPSFLASIAEPTGVDVILHRWTADYDDPDSFTFGLFHSTIGLARALTSAPELDRLLLEARLEPAPKQRALLYRRIEEWLIHSYRVMPLWHGRDCRVAAPTVQGAALSPSPPFVNYATLARRSDPGPRTSVRPTGGTLYVPLGDSLRGFDPLLAITSEQGDALSCYVETLTREVKGARVVPWLAESFSAEDGARRFRVRLRDNVRFHDGRRLTARDVRYSLERFVRDPSSPYGNSLAPVAGVRAFHAGEADEISGIRIVSPRELVIELTCPIAFFPALLSNATTAIVPEGATRFEGSWRDGCVGTGPFRVLRVEPDRRIELEANPEYWRPERPKASGIVLLFGLSSAESLSRLRAGSGCSIATKLAQADVDALRQDPAFAACYRETPSLSTYCLFFNVRRGPFANVDLRRAVAGAIDRDAVVRVLGRLVVQARRLVPPGLVADDAADGVPRRANDGKVCDVEATCLVHPAFEAQYAQAAQALFGDLRRAGVRLKLRTGMYSEQRDGSVDLYAGRWVGDYPDPDTFVHGVLHSEAGAFAELSGLAAIDALAERARAETDLAARHALYRDVERELRERAVLVPLFHDKHYSFAAPKVRGLDAALGTITRHVDYAELSIDE